ncbi:MAG: prepilin-type N-terminal cleavage/methylation domain-containing protein [bacterium]
MMQRFVRNGFTMIELLVVIAVIGILAVALLATLNPLEQIRKGRDTRTRADVSQLVSGIERYNASIGYFPWQTKEGQDLRVGSADIPFVPINGGATLVGCTIPNCTIAEALNQLTSTSEVKSSFVDRITGATYATINLYYNDADTGASVVGCFTPESNTFSREAFDRCKLGTGSWGKTFAAFVYDTATTVRPCPDGDATAYAAAAFDAADADEMICLP